MNLKACGWCTDLYATLTPPGISLTLHSSPFPSHSSLFPLPLSHFQSHLDSQRQSQRQSHFKSFFTTQKRRGGSSQPHHPPPLSHIVLSVSADSKSSYKKPRNISSLSSYFVLFSWHFYFKYVVAGTFSYSQMQHM